MTNYTNICRLNKIRPEYMNDMSYTFILFCRLSRYKVLSCVSHSMR